MEHLSILDLLLAVLVFVVMPIHSKTQFPSLIQKIRQHGEKAKVDAYRLTIFTWAGIALALIAVWTFEGRDWAELGLRSSSLVQVLWGTLIGGAFLAFLVWQLRDMDKSDSGAQVLKSQLGDLVEFMPNTDKESHWFRAVSINAGWTEELLYRGYLLWFFTPLVGLTLAAVITVVIFTFAHAYQGAKQMPAIAVVSVVTVAIFIVSGSVWLPIIFHAIVDIVQGIYLRRIMSQQPMQPTAA